MIRTKSPSGTAPPRSSGPCWRRVRLPGYERGVAKSHCPCGQRVRVLHLLHGSTGHGIEGHGQPIRIPHRTASAMAGFCVRRVGSLRVADLTVCGGSGAARLACARAARLPVREQHACLYAPSRTEARKCARIGYRAGGSDDRRAVYRGQPFREKAPRRADDARGTARERAGTVTPAGPDRRCGLRRPERGSGAASTRHPTCAAPTTS